MEQLLEELKSCKYKLDSVTSSIQTAESKIQTINENLQVFDRQLKGIQESKQYYKKAIDIIYERSVQELKDVMNCALNHIFVDKNLEMDIELSDKRGKSLTFVIKRNGKRVNLKRGMGMGVKCVISAILHIYYLQCKNSRILMLDEAYSNISKEYVANFFEFLSKLCKKLEFTVILITHDERFIQYADKVYSISDGYVQLIKESDVQQTGGS